MGQGAVAHLALGDPSQSVSETCRRAQRPPPPQPPHPSPAMPAGNRWAELDRNHRLKRVISPFYLFEEGPRRGLCLGLGPPAPNDPVGAIFYLGEAAGRGAAEPCLGKTDFQKTVEKAEIPLESSEFAGYSRGERSVRVQFL